MPWKNKTKDRRQPDKNNEMSCSKQSYKNKQINMWDAGEVQAGRRGAIGMQPGFFFKLYLKSKNMI